MKELVCSYCNICGPVRPKALSMKRARICMKNLSLLNSEVTMTDLADKKRQFAGNAK
jgi:hypothetical protein